MKVSHAHFPKVARMVFVEVRAVVVLAARHTTTAGVLAVFPYAAMASGDVPAAIAKVQLADKKQKKKMEQRVVQFSGFRQAGRHSSSDSRYWRRQQSLSLRLWARCELTVKSMV